LSVNIITNYVSQDPIRPGLFTGSPPIFRTHAAYLHLSHTLRAALPPSPDDTPEALLHRDTAAIAAVAVLLPTNPAELALAVSHVAAGMLRQALATLSALEHK